MNNTDVLLRWPNLGHPCLVRIAIGNQKTTFKALFAGKNRILDLKPMLKGRLFLQALNDTHKILQHKMNSTLYEKSSDIIDLTLKEIWEMERWPEALKQRLIPLKINKIENALSSSWDGRQLFFEWSLKNKPIDHFDYAYWVTLQIENKYLANLRIPQLFNFIHTNPSGLSFNVNFHSVYLHKQDWNDFNILHATDSHVSWRNDFIKSTVQNALGMSYANSFVNFNEGFRNFIRYANRLHQNGETDLILLTGDVVDFVNIERKVADEIGIPDDNFILLRNLLVAWPTCKNQIVDEELEVPLFTVLGNHDYRPSEYPLICTYELPGGTELYTSEQYSPYGLNRDEALAYESGSGKEMPYVNAIEGIRHQSHLDHVPSTYLACFNPDLNYSIPLGNHRIICLDSGPDKGEFASMADAIGSALGFQSLSESRRDFIGGSPDSEGFSEEQIRFLESQVKDVDGLIIVACHSPIINYRDNPPPHVFRETEHKELTPDEIVELYTLLYSKEYVPVLAEVIKKYYKKQNSNDKIGAHVIAQSLKSFTFDYWLKTTGWSLENTAHFKRGVRDPDLGRGVADERFLEFFKVITQKTKNNKIVELILTGHTHRSIEFTARLENYLIAFLHDYYIDNTVKNLTPNTYWKKKLPNYLNPLNNTINKKKWWQQHSPLFVQTQSVTVPHGKKGKTGILQISIIQNVITSIQRRDQPF